MSVAHALLLWGIAFGLALWNIWLERKVCKLEAERDLYGSTLVGIAQGRLAIKMERGSPRVSVIQTQGE